jgi:hypothetical protein
VGQNRAQPTMPISAQNTIAEPPGRFGHQRIQAKTAGGRWNEVDLVWEVMVNRRRLILTHALCRCLAVWLKYRGPSSPPQWLLRRCAQWCTRGQPNTTLLSPVAVLRRISPPTTSCSR